MSLYQDKACSKKCYLPLMYIHKRLRLVTKIAIFEKYLQWPRYTYSSYTLQTQSNLSKIYLQFFLLPKILYVFERALNLIKANYDEFKLSTSVCSIQVNCYTITVLHFL